MTDWSERERAHRQASDAELIAWVDEHDQLLGALPRAQLRQQGLIGRCTFILLFNSAGELCVHRRSLSKALYPGFWDVAAGGMVQHDEAYAVSAARELAEELGVCAVPLTAHGCFFFDQPGNRLWCAVFSTLWDGPLHLQPEEVTEVCFVAPGQLRQWAGGARQLCPDSLAALEHYLAG